MKTTISFCDLAHEGHSCNSVPLGVSMGRARIRSGLGYGFVFRDHDGIPSSRNSYREDMFANGGGTLGHAGRPLFDAAAR